MNVIDINDLHNSKSGRVALLGSGESVEDIDLYEVDRRMDIIGLNQHWRALDTPPWRCAVDPDSFEDIRSGEAPVPELLIVPHFAQKPTGFHPLDYDSAKTPLQDLNICVVHHIPRTKVKPREAHPFCGDFMGFTLGETGSYAPFTGLFALEIAVWAGYTDIRLLGYDCVGGHFFNPNFINNNTTYDHWALLLDDAATKIYEHEIEVTNCSPISTINTFPKGDIFDD